MNRKLLAIDPGTSGGFAFRDDEGIVTAEPMPDGMTAQADRLREIAFANRGIHAVVERVGCYMPGNSGPSAATFARHCGHLEAAMYCCGIPVAYNPTPQRWMKYLGTWPKDKMERKRAIKEWAQRRYPHLTVTLKTADALALLAWAEQQEGGR
jgi:hypothetical protein